MAAKLAKDLAAIRLREKKEVFRGWLEDERITELLDRLQPDKGEARGHEDESLLDYVKWAVGDVEGSPEGMRSEGDLNALMRRIQGIALDQLNIHLRGWKSRGTR